MGSIGGLSNLLLNKNNHVMIKASAIIFPDMIKKSMFKKSKKGREFLPVTISIFDEPDQYGQNISIILEQSKEEREQGKDRVFLGNGKVFYGSSIGPATDSIPNVQTQNDEDDGLFG